uniref:flagellar biosynthetic protein FliO n=1 Tax=Pararhizobium sp. IMCC3301 TaxID=3067904 RepID=UPI00274039F1|nr:flagellar biosynthetic protein FliO [Pararhizobium sp. IMCC3301]
MREYLLQFMSEEAAMGVQFLLALLVVLILFGVFVWFLRLITGKRRSNPPQRQNRLAILDRAQIDETRSLLLVRRDDVEHLVMIGGPSDVVVEANIDPYDEEDEAESSEKPGHQIARRVIAQRPLRTMSLSGSAAKVAESIGLTAVSRPEATLAPPPPPPRQAAAEPDRISDKIEPAEIRPNPVAAEPAPAEWQETGPAKVALSAESVAPIRPVQPVVPQHNISAPVHASMPEIRPQPKSETVSRDIEMHEAPAEDAPQYDLAADFENALWQEMQEADNSDQQTPAMQQRLQATHSQHSDREPQTSVPANRDSAQRPDNDAPRGRQNSSEQQQDDNTAAFAAVMSQEAETPQQPAYTEVQRERDNLALEDAIAGMLNDEQPNIDASDSTESSVYTPSESVPDGTERPVDTTHPGRVDDEMSRLLQELAVPNRA